MDIVITFTNSWLRFKTNKLIRNRNSNKNVLKIVNKLNNLNRTTSTTSNGTTSLRKRSFRATWRASLWYVRYILINSKNNFQSTCKFRIYWFTTNPNRTISTRSDSDCFLATTRYVNRNWKYKFRTRYLYENCSWICVIFYTITLI